MISAAQCRMARAGLGWGVRDLAKAAHVSPTTITRFETCVTRPARATLAVIQNVFESAGVEFTNGDAPGVKLKREGS
jgi:hypothetical protein